MNIYKLDINYSNYLHYYEPKIPFVANEKENRPFVGTLFTINGIKFYAPLTSPKPKHLTMKNAQDFLKIDEGRLGGINLNNMIPIPDNFLHEIELYNIKDVNYRTMLFKQLCWLNNNTKRIKNRAQSLYYLVINQKATNDLIERCCDFKLLHGKCYEFESSKKLVNFVI